MRQGPARRALDRRKRELRDEAGVVPRARRRPPPRFPTTSRSSVIQADGFPAFPAWGEKRRAQSWAVYASRTHPRESRQLGSARAGRRAARAACCRGIASFGDLLFRTWPHSGPTRARRKRLDACGGGGSGTEFERVAQQWACGILWDRGRGESSDRLGSISPRTATRTARYHAHRSD